MKQGKGVALAIVAALGFGIGEAGAVSVGFTDLNTAPGVTAGTRDTTRVVSKPGLTTTWTATGGVLQTKGDGAFAGFGIGGGSGIANPTDGEIDPGEMLKVTSPVGFIIDSIVLGYLFDGREFGDFQEVAVLRAKTVGGVEYTGRLTNTRQGGESTDPTSATDGATWLGTGFGSFENVSPSSETGFAVWRISNPFGSAALQWLELTAEDGTCGYNGNCTDQSDYTFISLEASAVPEPATLGLLGLGLLGAGAAVRRRRAS